MAVRDPWPSSGGSVSARAIGRRLVSDETGSCPRTDRDHLSGRFPSATPGRFRDCAGRRGRRWRSEMARRQWPGLATGATKKLVSGRKEQR